MFRDCESRRVACMSKEDYKEKVEEHRQEIDLQTEPASRMSRTNRTKNNKSKKQQRKSLSLMTILTFIFIFIPLLILVYVKVWYTPADSEVAQKADESIVQLETNMPSKANASVTTDEDEESKKTQDETAIDSSKEEEAKETAEAEEAQKVAAEQAKEAEAKKKAKEQAKAEAKEKAEAEAEAEAKTQQKSHTVQSTDNLYRIALKYYGDGSPGNIGKIKQANNLSSDSISSGQVLIIP